MSAPAPQTPFSVSPPTTHGHAPGEGPVNAQKHRRGLSRVWHAFGYSLAGLRAGWHETAFRQEAVASIILIPAAFWLGRSWVETVLLAGTVMLIMLAVVVLAFASQALRAR